MRKTPSSPLFLPGDPEKGQQNISFRRCLHIRNRCEARIFFPSKRRNTSFHSPFPRSNYSFFGGSERNKKTSPYLFKRNVGFGFVKKIQRLRKYFSLILNTCKLSFPSYFESHNHIYPRHIEMRSAHALFSSSSAAAGKKKEDLFFPSKKTKIREREVGRRFQ